MTLLVRWWVRCNDCRREEPLGPEGQLPAGWGVFPGGFPGIHYCCAEHGPINLDD